jgi:CheY-like chemotaxis protein
VVSSHGGKKQTIMVVDDSDDVRLVMAMQLRASGYEVVEAGDGREAIELARAHSPALVFMDINMPVMDGLTATRLLRAIKELGDMRIVGFSALGSGDNRLRALDAGCDAYVNKTANINRLPAIAESILSAA